MNFKVNVWTRGSTTVSHESDDVTATHHVTHFDEILLIVRVTGNDAITVRNFNHFAIAVTLTAPANNPAGHSDNISTRFPGKIDTLSRLFNSSAMGAHSYKDKAL